MPPPPMPCKRAAGDQHRHVGRQRAHHRAGDEDHDRDQHHDAAAVDVGELAEQRRHRGGGEEIRRHHPRQVLGVGERAPHGRQSRRDDGLLQRRQERRQHHADHDGADRGVIERRARCRALWRRVRRFFGDFVGHCGGTIATGGRQINGRSRSEGMQPQQRLSCSATRLRTRLRQVSLQSAGASAKAESGASSTPQRLWSRRKRCLLDRPLAPAMTPRNVRKTNLTSPDSPAPASTHTAAAVSASPPSPPAHRPSPRDRASRASPAQRYAPAYTHRATPPRARTPRSPSRPRLTSRDRSSRALRIERLQAARMRLAPLLARNETPARALRLRRARRTLAAAIGRRGLDAAHRTAPPPAAALDILVKRALGDAGKPRDLDDRHHAVLIERAHLIGERRRSLLQLGRRRRQRELRRRRHEWRGVAQTALRVRARGAAGCHG